MDENTVNLISETKKDLTKYSKNIIEYEQMLSDIVININTGKKLGQEFKENIQLTLLNISEYLHNFMEYKEELDKTEIIENLEKSKNIIISDIPLINLEISEITVKVNNIFSVIEQINEDLYMDNLL